MKKWNEINQEPIGYCSYCKGEILDSDDYLVKNGNFYHLECWEQMNTYDDGFGGNDSE